ncbi:hypothetical protein AQPW35_47290 [Rubrivivax pictus]|uniref:Uncharacterized protein n=2 Tax=Pseudaquabacterium pictum TaxID=2315236 RepID=A0A480B3L2_9BURK|nr:hypothetical protein AQPW35_47290 [Rubrivivax pictus]
MRGTLWRLQPQKDKLHGMVATKTLSKRPSKPASKKAAAKFAAAKPAVRAAARKAVVLGQLKASNGKVYQVLAPATGPRHLSTEDVQRAVELMVSAR